ncbi:MAG: hypothetical protein JWQ42_4173 [Edaphobacter sp.]|nr:hypothetical protein [Edaphobacter sp.]
MGLRLLAVTLLSMAPAVVFAQTSKSPDVNAGPVPPAIQQMPNRFQPPVPGCTDCYYTVPTGKVVGAMGTTNNEGVPPPDPAHTPKPAATPATAAADALSGAAFTDISFSSGNGVWPSKATGPLPLFIGSTVGLSPSSATALTLASACSLNSVDYTTTAGTPTTLPIPLSLWDVTTRTKLADLPTDWNSWKSVVYPPIHVGKQLPAGHKLQVRLTQPAELPTNFQFTIKVSAHCLKEAKSVAPAAVKPAASSSPHCDPGFTAVRISDPNGTSTIKCVKK